MSRKFILILLMLSFLFNFLWESIHGFLLYEGLDKFLSTDYTKLILYASTIDALMIISCYLLASIFMRETDWIDDKKGRIIFSTLAFVFAIFVEYRGVYLLKKWSYNEMMPVLFGIGLSPLVQLVVTGWISVLLARKISG